MRAALLGTVFLSPMWLLAGCADQELLSDAAAFTDGGARRDAASDSGPRSDANALLRAENGGGEPACYDEVDNDGDELLDCEDLDCTGITVCCVGSSADNCCAAADTFSATFLVPSAGCDDAPVGDCVELDAFAPFGAATPVIEAGTLVPQGGLGHGGIVIAEAIDPRAGNVTFSGNVEVPADRCATCIDAAGIALIDKLPSDGLPAVIELGIIVAGSRDQFVIYARDEIVARVPLNGAASPSVVIRRSSNGHVRFEVPGTDPIELDTAADAPLIPVVLGRTDNRAGERAVGVTSASISVRACDAPGALVRRSSEVFPSSTSAFVPTRLGRLSVAEVGSVSDLRVRAIYEEAGELYIAGETGAGELLGVLGFDPGDPTVAQVATFTRNFDPWLMQDGATITLFFAVEDGSGVSHLARADASPVFPLVFGVPRLVVESGALSSGVVALDGPTVWVDAGTWRMIARAHLDDGSTAFIRLSSADSGQTWSMGGSTVEDSTILAARREDLFAFDRSEIAEPAIVLRTTIDGTPLMELFYAGRRGTRWRIGTLASTDGANWRRVGEIMSGDGDGFDAVAVSSPAPVTYASGVFSLFYRGSNGNEARFGRAGRTGTVGE